MSHHHHHLHLPSLHHPSSADASEFPPSADAEPSEFTHPPSKGDGASHDHDHDDHGELDGEFHDAVTLPMIPAHVVEKAFDLAEHAESRMEKVWAPPPGGGWWFGGG